MSRYRVLDVEIYDEYGDDVWAQERFLVHGVDDVLWTSDVEAVVNYIRYDLERLLKELSEFNQKDDIYEMLEM